MNDTLSLTDIIGSNIALIDENIDRKIEFISQLNDTFNMQFIIGCNNSHKFEEAKIPGLFFNNFEMMEDLFDIKDLFGNKKHAKLFIINDIESCIKSKMFKTLLINGSQYNCTIIIFDGIDNNLDKVSNLKLNINSLVGIFNNDAIIKLVYDLYFTMFPPIDIFTNRINELAINNPNKYMHIIKSSKRYCSLDEKFKLFDYNFTSDDYTDEIIINELTNNKITLMIEI